MEDRLDRRRRKEPDANGTGKGLTKAGIRKTIARLHEELAAYEGSQLTSGLHRREGR